MKKGFFKRAVSGALSTAVTSMFFLINASGIPVDAASGDKFTVGNGTNQYKGTSEGYSYEVWLDNTGGSGSMTLGKGATFKAEWSASVSQGNFLARRGLDFGSEKKATDYDYIGLDYDATYSQTGSGGNSRLCVYGWFENRNAAGNPPLVEYYIIEDWVNWRPTANGASKTVTIDGGQYEIFAIDHTGPTIHGNSETFKQYFSVRKDTRTSGHITVSDHFKAWADQGWGIGNLYEVALNAEGWESSGVADVTMLDVYTTKKGDNTQPTTTPATPVEPDENGNYFKSTFETGTDNWKSRGDAKTANDSKNYYSGNSSLFVSGRTDNWHGASISLDPKVFVPGNTYSFSTAVLQKSGEATDMKLTLQYSLNGEENYDEVASATAKSGEWTKLENTAFKIPTGATNMVLYVEAPDSLTDFYIDDAQGSKEGVKSSVVTGGGTVEGSATQPTTSPVTPPADILYGDANCDGAVNIADATAIIQHLGNQDKYGLSEKGLLNGDCYYPGTGVTGQDALAIQQLEAEMIDSLPVGDIQLPDTTTENQPAVTTEKNPTAVSVTPTEYMDNVRKNMTNDVPASAINGNSDYGTLEEITYFSTISGKNKKANVLLPEGYSKNEKYPVLYVNHGIFGDHNTMLDDGMKIRSLAGNLAKSGEAEKMIIVFTSMYTSKTSDQCQGFTVEETKAYDAIREDLAECLMPYIEQNYSVKTGRENTAISGFSMGGRETLYVGVTRPDLFGYIGAACPAPGVTPGTDSFMAHPGNMAEADFKIKDTANYPYLWLITGGTNDTVVGQFPQSYHNILTTNGQDHIWQEIQGGGHDGSCVVPMMYNFMKGIFKVSGSSSSGTQPSQSTPATTTPPTTKPAGGVDISWIDPTKPMVAISFDDGAVGNAPTDTSMRIINALADSGFHSTFFYVGDWINNSGKEEEVKYAFSKGMEIANHTTSHPDLSTKSANEIRNEYDSCEAKLKNIIGTSPSKLLRLPYLASNQTVQQTLNDAPLITCSIDTGDWNNTSTYDMIDKIVKAKENGSLNGAIVLAHETYDTTAEAIEYLAPYLKGEGWQIVTVSEMFAVKNQQLNGGQIYTKVN